MPIPNATSMAKIGALYQKVVTTLAEQTHLSTEFFSVLNINNGVPMMDINPIIVLIPMKWHRCV